MANFAQYLYVCRVSTKYWRGAMRFNMVPLKKRGAPTFFALSTRSHHLCNSLSAGVGAFTRTTVPFVVVRPAHYAASRHRQTRDRAVFSSTAMPFTHLKQFAALFASAINKCFLLASFDFFRTWARAGVGVTAYVRVGASKLCATCGASKRSMPSTANFSFGV